MLKKIIVKIYKLIFKYTPQEKFDLEENQNYQKWIKNNEPDEEELEKQRNTKFEYMPKISIVVPMYNTPENYFRELLESVQTQTYSNWELCLADGSPKKADYLDQLINPLGEKVKYKLLDENKGISGNSNEALKLATGDFIALLDHDDIIPQFALYEVVKSINDNPEADFIYTDEDKILEEKDKRISPHFKQDFAIDTLRSYNYICHFSIFKKELMDKLQGFNSEFDGSQDYDLIFRAVENAKQIVHIPKILYNWRINANSVASGASAKPYAYVAAKKAILANIERQGIKGAKVEDSRIIGLYKITYPVIGEPKISIIIPNKDQAKTLKKCVDSILQKSTYKNYEIIIVENNSITTEIFNYYKELEKEKNIRVVSWEREFNYSVINNFGVKHANGELILFLNNDVEVLSDHWMEELVANTQRPEVGITGAKLLYPDGTIQHAGTVIGIGGIAGHMLVGMKGDRSGYLNKAVTQMNYSAVTAACMMMKRSVFEELGGFEEQLAVAFNDVDLCLRTVASGHLVVYNPYVELRHYESKSRGAEDSEEKVRRFQNEIEFMRTRWEDLLKQGDPYYNKNLSLSKWNYSLRAK